MVVAQDIREIIKGINDTKVIEPSFSHWRIHSVTSKEAIFYNVSLNGSELILTPKFEGSIIREECRRARAGEKGEHICTNVTYTQPNSLKVRDGKTVDTNITKTNGTFRYILDETKSLKYKFGEDTITVVGVVSYPSLQENVTTEAYPLSHIILNDSSIVFYASFDVNDTSGNIQYDYSDNDNDGTVINNPTWGSDYGVIGGAYNYSKTDSDNDHINFGSDATLDNMDEFSISVWVFPYDYGETGYNAGRIIGKLFGYFDASGGGWGLGYAGGSHSDTLRFVMGFDGTDMDVRADNTVPLNQWTHLVITWNGTHAANAVKFYNNSVEAKYTTQTNPTSTRQNDDTTDLRPAISHNNFDDWHGITDEIIIWNRTLSLSEVQDLYNNQSHLFNQNAYQTFHIVDMGQNGTKNHINITTNSTLNFGTNIGVRLHEWNGTHYNDSVDGDVAVAEGIVSWYHFDNRSSQGENQTFIFDWSGNARHLFNNGAQQNATGIYDSAFKHTTNGADFMDGVTDLHNSISDYPFTLSAWARVKDAAEAESTGIMVAIGNTSVNDDYYSINIIDATGQAGLEADTDSFLGGGNLLDDEYHQIVGVFNSSTSRELFVDGISVATSTSSVTFQETPNIVVGAEASLSKIDEFGGLIDEVIIWNRSLSANEIKDLYKFGRLKYETPTHWENITDGNNQITNFTILSSTTHIVPEFEFIANNKSAPFYSPLLRNNIAFESFFGGEEAAEGVVNVRNITQSITINDIVGKESDLNREPVESINILDALNRISDIFKDVIADVTLDSLIQKFLTVTEKIAESISINSVSFRLLESFRTSVQGLTIFAIVLKGFSTTTSPIESITIDDEVKRLLEARRVATDEINLFTIIGTIIVGINKVGITDNISINGVIERVGDFNRETVDSFTIDSFLERTKTIILSVTDSFNITSIVERLGIFIRGIIDSIVITGETGTTTVSGVAVPGIKFVDPTKANGFNQSEKFVEINISITESNLQQVIFNWNSTNYTAYNDSLLLFTNLDNRSSLGENDTLVVDLSKYSNNGTPINQAKPNITARYGGAYSFDGAGDYVDFNDINIVESLNEITVMAWIRTGGNHRGCVVCKTATSGADSVFFLRTDTDGQIMFSSANTTTYETHDVALTYNDNNWHHLVGRYNGTTLNLYFDGVRYNGDDDYSGASSLLSGKTNTNANDVRIGTNHAGEQEFKGNVDEVMIWNRSLTDEEITQHYFMNFYKYNNTDWVLYVNQTKNSTTELDVGNYTYFGLVVNTNDNENRTETRSINITNVVTVGASNVRNFSQPITIADVDEKLFGGFRDLVGELIINAIVSKFADVTNSISQGFTLTVIQEKTTGIFRIAVDNMGINSAIQKIKNFVISVLDSINISDSVDKLADFFRDIIQRVTITDVVFIDVVCPSSMVGNNNATSPCEITTCTQLQAMNENLTGFYSMVNDIDCSDTINWNNGAGFIPVGDSFSVQFDGELNGQNYTIENLYINRSATYTGLFGRTDDNSVIRNVNLDNATIRSTLSNVGALIGESNTATIINNSVINSNITGGTYTGGVFGRQNGLTVQECFVKNTFVHANSGATSVGGLGGDAASPTQTVNSYVLNITVSGTTNSKIGGLLGSSVDSIINKSYSTGIVIGNADVGGLTGFTDDAFTTGSVAIINSFSTAKVLGNNLNRTNGLVGDTINQNGAGDNDVTGDYINNSYWFYYADDNATSCYHDGGGSSDVGCVNLSGSVNHFYNVSNEPIIQWDFPPWDDVLNDTYYPPLKREGLLAPTVVTTRVIALPLIITDTIERLLDGSKDISQRFKITGTITKFYEGTRKLIARVMITDLVSVVKGFINNITDFFTINSVTEKLAEFNRIIDQLLEIITRLAGALAEVIEAASSVFKIIPDTGEVPYVKQNKTLVFG